MDIKRLRQLAGLLVESKTSSVFYHGSYDQLPVGTQLAARGDSYEKDWSNTSFYSALEYHRPEPMLSHRDAVFMCDNPDDIDLAGGATDWLLTVEPQGKVERHDINWGSEISGLIDDGYSVDSPEITHAAQQYWKGTPHASENVWEYLTKSAIVIKVEEY